MLDLIGWKPSCANTHAFWMAMERAEPEVILIPLQISSNMLRQGVAPAHASTRAARGSYTSRTLLRMMVESLVVCSTRFNFAAAYEKYVSDCVVPGVARESRWCMGLIEPEGFTFAIDDGELRRPTISLRSLKPGISSGTMVTTMPPVSCSCPPDSAFWFFFKGRIFFRPGLQVLLERVSASFF